MNKCRRTIARTEQHPLHLLIISLRRRENSITLFAGKSVNECCKCQTMVRHAFFLSMYTQDTC